MLRAVRYSSWLCRRMTTCKASRSSASMRRASSISDTSFGRRGLTAVCMFSTPACASSTRANAQSRLNGSRSSQRLQILGQIGDLRFGQAERAPRVVGAYHRIERWRAAVVEIRSVLRYPAKRRRAVLLRRPPPRVTRRTVGLRLAHDVAGGVQPRVGVGELGPAVTPDAIAGALEHALAARRGGRVEAPGRWRRRGKRKLVRLKRRQLRRDLIVRAV